MCRLHERVYACTNTHSRARRNLSYYSSRWAEHVVKTLHTQWTSEVEAAVCIRLRWCSLSIGPETSRCISLPLPGALSFSPTTSPLLPLISSGVLVQRVRGFGVQVAIDWIRSHAIHFIQRSTIALYDSASQSLSTPQISFDVLNIFLHSWIFISTIRMHDKCENYSYVNTSYTRVIAIVLIFILPSLWIFIEFL